MLFYLMGLYSCLPFLLTVNGGFADVTLGFLWTPALVLKLLLALYESSVPNSITFGA